MQKTWVFGYGSLIWRPGFNFIECHKARLEGWRRVFWQGSHDHRGTPDAPGRVVTLVPEDHACCIGMLYLLDADTVTNTFETLDHREKNGYDRVETQFTLLPPERAHSDRGHNDRSPDKNGTEKNVTGIVYIANAQNEAYLGEAPADEIAAQILTSAGPSGPNKDYLFALADALRQLDAHDAHVFDIENRARSQSGH